MSPYPILDSLRGRAITGVKELEYKRTHDVYDGSPCEWSAERGATHTLYCGEGIGKGTRPARLLNTVMYVGIDEDAEGQIVWEKWKVKRKWRFDNAA